VLRRIADNPHPLVSVNIEKKRQGVTSPREILLQVADDVNKGRLAFGTENSRSVLIPSPSLIPANDIGHSKEMATYNRSFCHH
jgi:hypothetical protein